MIEHAFFIHLVSLHVNGVVISLLPSKISTKVNSIGGRLGIPGGGEVGIHGGGEVGTRGGGHRILV